MDRSTEAISTLTGKLSGRMRIFDGAWLSKFAGSVSIGARREQCLEAVSGPGGECLHI